MEPSKPSQQRPGLIVGIALVVTVLAALVVFVRPARTTHAVVGATRSRVGRGNVGHTSPRRADATPHVQLQAGLRAREAEEPSGAAAAGSLARLFDTDAPCRQYGTVSCERVRALAEACEEDETAACRSLLEMFSIGQLADLAMAKAVAELLCRRDNECERRDQLLRFSKASLNFADHVDAPAACRAGDALACAIAGLVDSTTVAQRLVWAERACTLGVATRGGCIEIPTLALRLKVKVAAVQRACDAGSVAACSLVFSMLTADDAAAPTGIGDKPAAHQAQAARALQRCCELAPEAECCNALIP